MPPAVTSAHRAFVRFCHRAGGLKFLPRTGWRDRGVPAANLESVAGHSFRLALLAYLAALEAGAGLDAGRVLKLALIHDLPETLAGDPPPYAPAAIPTDPVARRRFLQQWHHRDPARAAAKADAEAAALATLAADLSPAGQTEIAALWAEYQGQVTPEARFVKQADRLETFLQSREYLAIDSSLPMDSFATEAATAITQPWLAALRDAARDEIGPAAPD